MGRKDHGQSCGCDLCTEHRSRERIYGAWLLGHRTVEELARLSQRPVEAIEEIIGEQARREL